MFNIKILTAKASIGDPVRNDIGENLGVIEDILPDESYTDVQYAIVSIHEVDKQVLVVYQDLTFVGEEGYFLLPVQKQQLVACRHKVQFEGKMYFKL